MYTQKCRTSSANGCTHACAKPCAHGCTKAHTKGCTKGCVNSCTTGCANTCVNGCYTNGILPLQTGPVCGYGAIQGYANPVGNIAKLLLAKDLITGQAGGCGYNPYYLPLLLLP